MKIDFRKYPKSECWKYKFSFMKAWSNKLWFFNFYRFSLVFDFRKNWINDMIGRK